MLFKTQIYEFHRANGKIIDFAGFEMPVWYKGTVDECLAVRNSAGIFDVSHMGRAFIKGGGAQNFLDYLTPNDVSSLKPLQAHYSVLSNKKGGIIDDFIISKLEQDLFFIVFNASNREKDLVWLRKNAPRFKVTVEDISEMSAMVAVQGPKSKEVMKKITQMDNFNVPRFGCGELHINGTNCIVTGTGYTGEEGFEISILDAPVNKPTKALNTWNMILREGKPFNIIPCGLGARDVLRLEAGMCLYGNDITDDTTPLEARIGFVVKLDKKSDFIGKGILAKQKTEGVSRMRVGLKIKGSGIPRSGFNIMKNGSKIGLVTSGTYSPILKTGIAMGYLPKEYANSDTIVQIDIRGKLVDAEVTQMPFYDTYKYGWKRTAT